MQIWAESGKSALPICNYSQILYQFLMFTQNLKRSHKCFFIITVWGSGGGFACGMDSCFMEVFRKLYPIWFIGHSVSAQVTVPLVVLDCRNSCDNHSQ